MSGSFDFGTAFEPERPRASVPQPPVPVRPSPRPTPPTPPTDPGRRGQGLSWVSAAVAFVGAVTVGLGLFFLLDSIRLTPDGVDDVEDWASLIAVGLCLVVLSCAGAIVSLVRARPRVAATIALVAALVLPIVATIWGGKVGLGSLFEHARKDAEKTGADAVLAIEQTLAANGPEVGPLLQFLLNFLTSS